MTSEIITITVPDDNQIERLDLFITANLDLDMSRSYIQKLIKKGSVTFNGKAAKANLSLKPGDEIVIEIPEPEKLLLEPENIPLNIVYQDEFLAVINKQPGLVVHPGLGNMTGTLVSALLFHIKDLSSIGGVERPGIVHRLDRDTSGLMVIAKNDHAHKFLTNEFADRKVIKRYSAVVKGKPLKETGIIDLPIGRHAKYGRKMTIAEEGGRNAVTEYKIVKIWNHKSSVFSLLDITLHTGRTHQIRVHLSSLGMPVLGDPIYSKKPEKYNIPFLLLQSKFLSFRHPSNSEYMEFSIPLADHIQQFIDKIEKMNQ